MFSHAHRLLCFLASLAFVSAAPKVLICSDSTTANYTSGPLQGWGFFLHQYMSTPVINLAKNGRSARSFIREGLWTKLLAQTAAGDFIVLEMGHNDNGDPSMQNSNKDKASRSTLPGIGNNTTKSPKDKNGGSEIAHTFGWYLRQMINDAKERRAIPLVSGMVPTNSFQGGKMRTNWPFARDAELVARQEGVEFIDHTKYTVQRYQGLGEREVAKLFPKDHTHTNAQGARINTETFITALKCAKSKAAAYIGPKGQAVSQKC